MEQQAAILAGALGGKPAWPSLEERLAAFEEALAAEPKRIDPEELELRRALGLKVVG